MEDDGWMSGKMNNGRMDGRAEEWMMGCMTTITFKSLKVFRSIIVESVLRTRFILFLSTHHPLHRP